MRRVLVVLLVLGALWAVLAWPRLREVETGRTPEYPDLQVHDYRRDAPSVSKAALRALAKLKGWTFVASGTGPRGAEVQAVHAIPLVGLKEDVTIRIWVEGNRTRVSVRSRSRSMPWDFGANARNIRSFLEALGGEVS